MTQSTALQAIQLFVGGWSTDSLENFITTKSGEPLKNAFSHLISNSSKLVSFSCYTRLGLSGKESGKKS